LSGGSGLNGVVATGGVVSAAAGSYLAGYSLSGSNALINTAGSVTTSLVGGVAIAVLGTSNGVTLTSASLGADVQMTGAGNTLTLQNGTTVTSGLRLVDSSNANNLTLSSQTLSIASAPTTDATTVVGWNQINLTRTTSVTMAGNVALAGAGSLLSIDSTSYLSQIPSGVTITTNTVRNSGTIAIGASQTLTIAGNYEQRGGTLQTGFSGSTFGKIVVSGNALLSNANFAIAPNSTPLTPGATYRSVLSATGGTTGTFASGVYQGIAYSFVVDGTALDLVAAGGSAVSNTIPTPLLNGAQATGVLNQAQATIQLVRDRMEKMGGSAYQGTDAANYFWATPYNHIAQQSANGVPSAAYKQNTGGFAMGADKPIDPDLRVGGALLLQNSSLTGQNTQTQDGLTTASYQLVAYAKQKLAESTEFNVLANAAIDQNNSNRLIDGVGNNGQVATASYKSWHGLVSGELAHRIKTGQHTLTPLARIDYGYVRIGGYNENGAGLSNLVVNSQSQSSTVGSLGAKYRYDINEVSRILVRATAGYDLSSKPTSLTATDGLGSTFTSYGNNPGSFVMQGGVGYEMQTKDNLRIRLNYDYSGRNSGYSNNMINASMIVLF
jgi:hypothetical protein